MISAKKCACSSKFHNFSCQGAEDGRGQEVLRGEGEERRHLQDEGGGQQTQVSI